MKLFKISFWQKKLFLSLKLSSLFSDTTRRFRRGFAGCSSNANWIDLRRNWNDCNIWSSLCSWQRMLRSRKRRRSLLLMSSKLNLIIAYRFTTATSREFDLPFPTNCAIKRFLVSAAIICFVFFLFLPSHLGCKAIKSNKTIFLPKRPKSLLEEVGSFTATCSKSPSAN